MDKDASQANGVESFLMTIPEAKVFLLKKENNRPHRLEVFQAIRKRVSNQLVTKNDDDWLSQLIELELEGEDVSDIASHIARLLTSYVVNHPWVYHPETMRTKLSSSINGYVSEIIITSPRSGRDKSVILDYKNVAELLSHRERISDNPAQASYVMAEGSRPYLKKVDKRSEILAESDAVLGIAGFSPFYMEPELHDDGHSPEISPLDDSMETEEEFINQYRSHIKLTEHFSRQRATISFASYESPIPFSLAQAKLFVEHGIRSLASQLNILQEKSGRLDQLLFIRSRLSEIGMEPQYAEVASIDMRFIKEFIHVYWQTREKFGRCLNDAEKGLRMVPTFFQNATTAVTFGLMSIVNPLLGFLFITGSYLYEFAQHYSRRDYRVVEALSPLLKTLQPILDSMGIIQFNPEQGSQSAAIETLHTAALVVQSLCLMVQSYLRESVTPMDFEFLITPIYDFVLEGASPEPRSTKIYARSQQLSCLGEMLGKDVLVFGLEPSYSSTRLDLVATPAQIASIWGPAELIIRKSHELTIAQKRRLNQTPAAKLPTSAHETTGIISIKIQGGIIVPTGGSGHGIQQWHWKSLSTTDIDEDADTHTCIDLNTQIRIGGVGSHLSLHPVGPATWNKDCPSSTKSILDLDASFSSSFRDLGVQDPGMSLKSVTFGLQGGQFVNLIAQGNYERTLGKTVKDQTINSIAFFETHLAKYNRMWGLFVSVCTGVMTRIRLRELVAFFCLQCAAEEIPQQPGRTRKESRDAFAEALCGNDSLNNWFESLISEPVITESLLRLSEEEREKGRQKERQKEREELQNRVLSLFVRVLKMLENTGVSKDGDLVLACLSKDKDLHGLTFPATRYPWIKVLSDSSSTATFACLSLHCFQDRDCKCRNDKWNLPDDFRLATKLFIDRPFPFSPRDPQQDGLQMKTYLINSANLNLMARVAGYIKEPDSDWIYYVSVKKSVLSIDFVKSLHRRQTLREGDSPTAVKCIVSGGAGYLNQLERLIQEGNMETQFA